MSQCNFLVTVVLSCSAHSAQLCNTVSLLCRKKLSNFSHSCNWKSASNYVAKRYMETVDREVYFEDVRLQMEAKLWGEEYNRHRPPKQVLFFFFFRFFAASF